MSTSISIASFWRRCTSIARTRASSRGLSLPSRPPMPTLPPWSRRSAGASSAHCSRDLLRPVFLTRSGSVQMEAGELSEAEVELEVVEPWDTGVNMFSAELLGKVLVVCAQVLHVGSVVVGDDDGVVRNPHVSVQSEEESVGEVAGVPCRHGFPES